MTAIHSASRCASWGAIDRATLEGDRLRLEGWMIPEIPEGRAAMSGARVSAGGSEARLLDLATGLPTPRLAEVCWSVPGAARAGFRIVIPLSEEERTAARDRIVVVVPSVAPGTEGDCLVSVVEPSLAAPSQELVESIGGGFREVSFEFLGHLIAKLGLRPSDHVLDVGCGLGRIAYGLSYYLDESARYEGFDVAEPLVRWAEANITARRPGFRFQRVDLENAWYNPRGHIRPEEFRFPYADASFDAAVATSVFTHMRPAAVRRYLEEIHRVLKPGGRCLSTWFLLNVESRRGIESGRSTQRLVHRMEDFFTTDPRSPEGSIGFEEETLWSWLEERGLSVSSTHYGTWCGRSGPGSYQDLLILRKEGSTAERAPAAQEPASRLVPCEGGGNVVLDAPLFRLRELVLESTREEALRSWSARENQPKETARWALAALERAGVLSGSAIAAEIPAAPREATAEGTVSIIIPSFEGRRNLERLLPSIAEQTYPRIETVVVDNGSRREPVSWLAERFPWARVVSLPEDAGFAGASNRGAAEASGDLLFFLNNDTRLERTTVELLVARLEGEERVAAVVPMLRSMAEPAFVNAMGNQILPEGWARDAYIGHLDLGQLSSVRSVPSASFGAVLVPRAAYEAVGPLDEAYGYYYEDMDWSWRARSAGLAILAEPRAIVFHESGATSRARPTGYKLRFVARNRLRFAARNLPRASALRFIASYAREDVREMRRALQAGESEILRAYRTAWAEFLRMLPGILRFRKRAKACRLVPGDRLLAEMDEYPHPRQSHDGPVLALPHVIEDYGPHLAESGQLPESSEHSERRILLASGEIVRADSSGPAIRYLELARALSSRMKVTLLAPAGSDEAFAGLEVSIYRPGDARRVRELMERCDSALVPIDLLIRFPSLRGGSKPLAIDLEAPSLLESDGEGESPALQREVIRAKRMEAVKDLLQEGDFFVCASERQRDFWLGMLAAAGRAGPLGQARDESLRMLIDVVPYGLSRESAPSPAGTLRGTVPGWGHDDNVVLWIEEKGQDWRTPIEAMARVAAREPRARLHGFGEDPAAIRAAERSASEAGLLGEHVFFQQTRTRSSSFASHLAESDVGLSSRREGPEAILSVRTHLLEGIAAGLPLVVTESDPLARLVREHGLGRVIPEEDPEALAEALLDVMAQTAEKVSWSERFDRARAGLSWERAVLPLLRFALAPHRAFDRAARENLGVELAAAHADAATPVGRLPGRALTLLRNQGPFAVLKRTARHVRWRLSRLA